jgi:hypothetical protein
MQFRDRLDAVRANPVYPDANTHVITMTIAANAVSGSVASAGVREAMTTTGRTAATILAAWL